MLLANEGDVIFDTTIYYKNAEFVQRWLTDRGLTVYFTANNALELMTPKIGEAGEDWEKRKQAAQNLLTLTDGGDRIVPDSELIHVERLGYKLPQNGPWQESVRRFITMPDATEKSYQEAGINWRAGNDAINASYGNFGKKIEAVQRYAQNIWKENKAEFKAIGITYEEFRSEPLNRRLLGSLDIENGVIAAHVDRICAMAKVYNLQGTLIDETEYQSAIGVYAHVYTGYLLYALVTGKRDKNDFGDLQFFAFCDAGYKLVGAENRWHDICEQEELQHLLLRYP